MTAPAPMSAPTSVPTSARPTTTHPINRRRALSIFAGTAAVAAGAAGGLTGLTGLADARAAVPLRRWYGVALGAPATITLAHGDPLEADRLFARCETEIARLEKIFSLHRPDSEISRLNRDGRLAGASHELVELIAESKRYGERTGGAFDITVQPLWRLFAAHFRNDPAAGAGPAPADIEAALAKVDYRAITLDAGRVAFAKPGMAITMNGIAQGYITDRVADMLRAEGYDRLLINLGEYRALGDHPDGRPWQIGLADPDAPGRVRDTVSIIDRAVATSGGYGTPFSLDGHYHHLFDPATGDSARHHASVSVVAKRATTADAMSTALCIMAPAKAAEAAAAVAGMTTYLTDMTGRNEVITT